jgi:hypothetical protein
LLCNLWVQMFSLSISTRDIVNIQRPRALYKWCWCMLCLIRWIWCWRESLVQLNFSSVTVEIHLKSHRYEMLICFAGTNILLLQRTYCHEIDFWLIVVTCLQ